MKKLWIALIILAAASPVFGADVMKFAYATTGKPFSWDEDGKMQGILIDIAEETIQNRLGIAISHQGHP